MILKRALKSDVSGSMGMLMTKTDKSLETGIKMKGFMMTQRFLAFSLLLTVLITASCRTPLGRFPLMSTKSAEISRVDLKKIPFHRDIEGKDSRVWFLFFPLGGAPTIEEAMDNCLAEGNGDFIKDARIYETWWSFLIFSGGGYAVRGDVGDSLGSGSRDLQ
jgi:hypothetical protein